MAAGDLALKLLLTAETGTAITAVSAMGSSIIRVFGGMGNSIGNLAFGFRNLSTAGTIGMDAIKQGITGLASGFLSLGAIAGVAIAGASVALGVTAVKAAGDFQAAITRLATSAGELPKNLQMVSAGILKISVDTGTSADMLTSAMYKIESSNYHAAAGLQVLTAAAQGAKTENADLATVSQALLGVMTNYHLSASNATSAMNGLIAVVQNGNTTLQALSSSMAQALPTAASLGISFAQVGGAIDTMTSKTTTARQAAQNLAHVLLALNTPSGVATKSMAAVGLSAQQVKDALAHQGLPQALQMIEDHVGKEFPKGSVQYETALKNILGGMTGFKVAAQLTGASLKDTQAHIDAITAAMGGNKNAVLGWDAVQQTFNFRMDQAKAAVGAFLIQLGTQLFPIFNRLMTVLAPIIQGFLNWIVQSGVIRTVLQTLVNVITFLVNVGTTLVNFFKNNEVAMAALKAVLILLGIVIVTVIVTALYLWAAAAITAGIANIVAFWPIYLVILIIIAVIALVILAVQHWGQIMAWFGGVFSAIGTFVHGVITAIGGWFSWLGGVIQAIWAPIGAFLMRVWQNIWNSLVGLWNVIKTTALVIFAVIAAIIIAPFVPLINWFKAHWSQIQAVLTTAWNAISTGASIVWGAITTYITTQVTNAENGIKTAWNAASQFLSSVWHTISSTASSVWNTISSNIMKVVNPLKDALSKAWDSIKSGFSTAMNSLSGIASSAWNAVAGAVKSAINTLITIIDNMIGNVNKVTGTVGIPAIPTIPHLASGGTNLPAGMYWTGENGPELLYLPQGSSVLSHSQSMALMNRNGFALSGSSGGGGYSGPATLNIALNVDGRKMTEVVGVHIATELRRQGTVKNR